MKAIRKTRRFPPLPYEWFGFIGISAELFMLYPSNLYAKNFAFMKLPQMSNQFKLLYLSILLFVKSYTNKSGIDLLFLPK